MGARLQALLEYQELESQIVDIRRQLDRKKRQIAAQNKKLEAALAAIQGEREEIRRIQIQFDELDVDVKARSSHIGKLREHLNTVKTNKEYAAVLSQLNNEKADASRIESRALELMQAIDDRKRGVSTHEETERQERERLDGLQAELERTRQTFAERLESLEQRRDAAAASLERETVALFHRLSERYEGEVMAELVRPNPRRDEFVCGGCHMGVQTDLANMLRLRDEVVTCRNCGRILFLKAS